MTALPAVQPQTFNCLLHRKRIIEDIDLSSLTQIVSQLDHPSILGGSKIDSSNYSYWTAEPIDTFEFAANQQGPFEKLQLCLDRYRLNNANKENLPPGIFCGGWIGYFAYELGRYIEKIPQTTHDDINMPLIRLCFYDKVICYDHAENCFWLFVLQTNAKDAIKPKFSSLQNWLEKAKNTKRLQPYKADLNSPDITAVKSNMTRAYYHEGLAKIKKHIIDGDVYQVNFAQRFSCQYTQPPISLYHWQNTHNPSPYAAYIDTGSSQIVSASPELFIQIQDRKIKTTPIKGTRPRLSGGGPQIIAINKTHHNQLLTSKKEQAELNMIIDIERNDLGRICRYGTIEVTQPRTITPYPTLFHAVATVTGHLRDEITFPQILGAMFPGGSITGAPKISSMHIIDHLEPNTRGVYTGCIGFIGINSNVCLNIAIRTIIISKNKAFCHAGGGIVADSNAEAEFNETMLKAKALIAAMTDIEKIQDKK